MRYVIGLDLSLTAPAAVAIPIGWRPGNWRAVDADLLKPDAPSKDDLEGQFRRYRVIAEWAKKFAATHGGGAVAATFRESYGFSQNTTGGSRIMESGGIVCYTLYTAFAIVPRPVAANSARKFLLGFSPSKRTGHNAKVEVQAALFKAGAPKKWEENICDAFVVANFGLTELGQTGVSVAGAGGRK